MVSVDVKPHVSFLSWYLGLAVNSTPWAKRVLQILGLEKGTRGSWARRCIGFSWARQYPWVRLVYYVFLVQADFLGYVGTGISWARNRTKGSWAHIHTQTQTDRQTHTHTHARAHAHTDTHTHTHKHTHTYTHALTHAHTHTHTHTHTRQSP